MTLNVTVPDAVDRQMAELAARQPRFPQPNPPRKIGSNVVSRK